MFSQSLKNFKMWFKIKFKSWIKLNISIKSIVASVPTSLKHKDTPTPPKDAPTQGLKAYNSPLVS